MTDSQVGIQRPSKLRRAEETSRSRVLGYLTDHYVAKLVALLFASALVFLIDREITTALLESQPFDVEAGDAPQGPPPPGQRLIVLQAEPGVAVRSFGPRSVRVTIRGQQKLSDQIKSKPLLAVVAIKKEWLNRETQGSQTIEGNAINFGVVGAKVEIDPPIHVELDPEIQKDLTLVAAPRDVAPGFVAEVTFQPPQVKVLGAKSSFEGGSAVEQVTVTIPALGKTSDFTMPVSLPADLAPGKRLRVAPGQQLTARVRLSPEQKPKPLVVKDVQLSWLASKDYEFSPVGLERQVVTVTLQGTAEAVATWADRLDELRRTLQAQIDTEKVVAKVAAQLTQPGSHQDDSGRVEIVRIPDNLKVVGVIPELVEVRVTKR